MFGLCVAHSIQLEIEWIPRNMNTVADELSTQYLDGNSGFGKGQ